MGAVGKFLLSPVAALAGAFKKPKAAAPAPLLAQPQATPRASSALADALSARRGTRANQRTGARGAEAPAGVKTKLGR